MEVQADEKRLRPVLLNLLGNAVKFTEEGGIVVSVSSERQTDEVYCLQFSVQDTGIGIPQDKLKSIFNMFQQADGSTTRKFGGKV